MRTPIPGELRRILHRFDCLAENLLTRLPVGTPLFIQCANRIAGLGARATLHDIVADDTRRYLAFPENGLHLCPGEIHAVHGIDLVSAAGSMFSLEFAMHDEARAISLGLMLQEEAHDTLRTALLALGAARISPAAYASWRERYAGEPELCPCCAQAAIVRRENPEDTPVFRILDDAARRSLQLHCAIEGWDYAFSTWLTADAVTCSEGHIKAAAADCSAILEVDAVGCQSYLIGTETLDGEVFSTMRVFDSLGTMHFRISARGKRAAGRWTRFCHGG